MINGNLFFTESELEKRIFHFNSLMKKKYLQTDNNQQKTYAKIKHKATGVIAGKLSY